MGNESGQTEINETVKTSLVAIKKNHKRLILIFAGLIVVAAVIAGLVFSGLVYIGIKNPKQNITLVYQVCGNNIIDRYNQIRARQPETDAENQQYEADFNELANEIQALADSTKDPTCQYMLFSNYQRQGDVVNMKQTAGLIVEMNKEGQYVNGEIDIDLYSIPTLRVIINGED